MYDLGRLEVGSSERDQKDTRQKKHLVPNHHIGKTGRYFECVREFVYDEMLLKVTSFFMCT